ncbi:MAG: acyl-CoA desaturase [Dehalococcoidia bacterium]
MTTATATAPTAPTPITANDYVRLKRLVKAEGLLESQTWYYVFKTVVALTTLAAAIAMAVTVSHPLLIIVAAAFMGFASTQIALLGHDVGHRQAYRGRRTNTIGRYFFGNVLLGISHSWWNTKHNQHHANPNHVDEDPDIQFPMIAFTPEQVLTRHKVFRPLMAVQAFVFVFFFPLQALNMRVTSVTHLLAGNAKRPLRQGAFMAVHFIGYAAILFAIGSWPMALVFFLVHQGVFGLYNSSVFATNHKGMPVITSDTRLDFFREQVLTARDVAGHPVTDFWYGGLNYQIEHHLFPTMPRNRLRDAQPIVEAFCKGVDVPYHSTGLLTSYREGFAHLHRATASLRRRSSAAEAS